MMPWWVYLAIFLLVLLITGAVWWMIFSNRGGLATESGPTPRPLFVIITSTPTSLANAGTDRTLGTATPTPLTLPDATSASPAAKFMVGQVVEISGTEGAGLSVRFEPGVGFPALSIGFDGDTFTIVEGPSESDGYSWWAVDLGEGDVGWVVEDFLVPSS